MKKLKIIKSSLLTSLLAVVTVGVTSCTYTTPGTLTTYSATNYLTSNNSPLNNTFCNSPISTYAQTEELALLSYQTVGQYAFEEEFNESTEIPETNTTETTNDILILEGAKAVIVFASQDVMDAFDTAKNIELSKDDGLTSDEWVTNLSSDVYSIPKVGDSSETYENGTDFWIFYRNKGGIQYQDNSSDPVVQTGTSISDWNETTYYENAISQGMVYQFLIDTDIPWVDNTGAIQTQVSSKDFERAVETYTLASELNYNRNGYFLDLMGLNFDESVGYKLSNGEYADLLTTSYDVENYTNGNDNFFTLHIDTPYPYTFGLLAKDYFAPVPHSNQKIQQITLASTNYGSSPIKYTDTGGSLSIDESTTDWSRIYGSGGLGVFTNGTWYAGAYYVSAFTSSQIVFELNDAYMDTVGKDLLDYNTGLVTTGSNEEKIKKIFIYYGSGTSDTFYELFKSGQSDYLSAVPNAKMSEAARLFVNNGLVPYKTKQITQSNYIVYTPSAYVVDSSTGDVKVNNYMGNAAQFIYKWNSEDSTIIRAGIAGLVNYYQLSLLNLPSSGDFQLSAVPYGEFTDYYESVAKGYTYGGLPRPYSDYEHTTGTEFSDSFTIPYYEYSSSGVNIKTLTIDQTSLQTALRNYGFSTSSPLNFSIKFGDYPSTNYTSFLNALKASIEKVSGGLISVNINQRDATNPTATEWYNSQSSPLGYSYWAPDYNGVGTWIEANTTIQSSTINGDVVEAVPETNAHNAYMTFLSSLVTAVNYMNATWDKTSNSYKVNSLSNSDSYADDTRIQKALSNETLSAMGIALSENSDTSDGYTENNATDENMLPGHRYGLLAIGLLNKLIDEGVFNQTVFQEYVNDPSKLIYSSSAPTNYSQVYLGGDVINTGESSGFSKWIGVYAGESNLKALYENTVLDSDYGYVPRSESGLNDIIYSLVNPIYVARVGSQILNYRDFGMK